MGWLHTIDKFYTAALDILKGGYKGQNPKLIMTLLVKNEELLLEKNLIFHRKMGVDAFIITDNNSTDSTPEIIQRYVEKGWIVESIKEEGTNYDQKKWVDRMIWSAKKVHKADWIINADADEFWYSMDGNLKAEMCGWANVLKCRVVGVLPEDGVDFWKWDKVVRPIPEVKQYDLSNYTIFRRYTYKVAHSAARYLRISMGNHKVNMLFKRQMNSDITIYHYNVMGKKLFIEKMVNGGEQIEKNPKESVARHWRYFYKLYKAGELENEYDRVIATQYHDEFSRLGYIYHDSNVADVLKDA
ncbi:MAG: glycosyltransferase family 2 protein [Rikenellaceae bacterium]